MRNPGEMDGEELRCQNNIACGFSEFSVGDRVQFLALAPPPCGTVVSIKNDKPRVYAVEFKDGTVLLIRPMNLAALPQQGEG